MGLLHGALQASVPAAPPDLWLATVQLAERLGAAPAMVLARRACAAHPAAEVSAQKLAQLQRAAAGTAGTSDRPPLTPSVVAEHDRTCRCLRTPVTVP